MIYLQPFVVIKLIFKLTQLSRTRTGSLEELNGSQKNSLILRTQV